MPSIEETLGKLPGAKIVFKLDANCGFWQRKSSKDSTLLTTSTTPCGRYSFNRLSFDISSAPEHYQKMMQGILEGLLGQVCQVDHILVFAVTHKEHDERLEAVLETLEKADVTLSLEKCMFSLDKLQFFGHVVAKDGGQVDSSKVEARQNFDVSISCASQVPNNRDQRETPGFGSLYDFADRNREVSKSSRNLYCRVDTTWPMWSPLSYWAEFPSVDISCQSSTKQS